MLLGSEPMREKKEALPASPNSTMQLTVDQKFARSPPSKTWVQSFLVLRREERPVPSIEWVFVIRYITK